MSVNLVLFAKLEIQFKKNVFLRETRDSSFVQECQYCYYSVVIDRFSPVGAKPPLLQPRSIPTLCWGGFSSGCSVCSVSKGSISCGLSSRFGG